MSSFAPPSRPRIRASASVDSSETPGGLLLALSDGLPPVDAGDADAPGHVAVPGRGAPVPNGMTGALEAARRAVARQAGDVSEAGDNAPLTSLPPGTSLGDLPKQVEPTISPDFLVSLSYGLWMFRVSQQAIVDETWRREVPWVPNFTVKCLDCEAEFDEQLEECPDCGGAVRGPDQEEYQRLMRMTRETNPQGMTFFQVWRASHLDAEMTDDGWLILESEYTWDGSGRLVGSRRLTEYHADTRLMRPVKDSRGRFGASDEFGKMCLVHRKERHTKDETTCRKCGRELFPVAYVCLHPSEGEQGATRYAEFEVIQYQIQRPSPFFGVSPVYTMWRLGLTGVKMEEWQRVTYANQQPARGALLFKGITRRRLDENVERNRVERRLHPNEHPKYAMDADADMKFVSFMPTPEQMQSIEHYELLRKAIGSMYGVSNIMMGDSSTGIGYANQGQQIHVSNRGVQKRKRVLTTYAFAQYYRFAGIEDHHLEFPPSDEEDQMAALQREQLEFTIDAQADALGMKVWVDEQGKHHRIGAARGSGGIDKPQDPDDEYVPEPPEPPVEVEKFLLPEGRAGADSTLQRHMLTLLQGLEKWAHQHKSWAPERFRRGLEDELDNLIGGLDETIREDVSRLYDRELTRVEHEVGMKDLVDRNIAAGEFIRQMLSDPSAAPAAPLQNLKHKLHGSIMEVVYKAYTEEVIDLDYMVRDLGNVIQGERYQLERLARNVTTYVSQNTRADAFKRAELARGERLLYEWSVKHDSRTSDVCKAIDRDQRAEWKARGTKGLPLDVLEKLNQRHSTTGSPLWPHHNCRSTLIRVVRQEDY